MTDFDTFPFRFAGSGLIEPPSPVAFFTRGGLALELFVAYSWASSLTQEGNA